MPLCKYEEGDSDICLQPLQRRALHELMCPTVVQLFGYDGDVEFSLGAGVLISNSGYVLTSYSAVVYRCGSIKVKAGGRKYGFITVIKKRQFDLAIIKIKRSRGFYYANVASHSLVVGQEGHFIGHPCSMYDSYGLGMVSYGERSRNELPRELMSNDGLLEFPNVSAMTQWKNICGISERTKGAPIFNSRGEVAGVHRSTFISHDYSIFLDDIKNITSILQKHKLKMKQKLLKKIPFPFHKFSRMMFFQRKKKGAFNLD